VVSIKSLIKLVGNLELVKNLESRNWLRTKKLIKSLKSASLPNLPQSSAFFIIKPDQIPRTFHRKAFQALANYVLNDVTFSRSSSSSLKLFTSNSHYCSIQRNHRFRFSSASDLVISFLMFASPSIRLFEDLILSHSAGHKTTNSERAWGTKRFPCFVVNQFKTLFPR
jgi:hypothetical protein